MKTVFLIEIKKGQLKVLESNLSKLLRKPNLNFKFLKSISSSVKLD